MNPITIPDFLLRVGCALICGLLIGFERQWRQRQAGMRTYTLVAVGSALFVMVSALTHTDTSPTRIAAQIVAGIGFLGAGVIMRSGLNVRGLNTAATIWCSAAVGTLAGIDQPLFAAVGAAAVLAINLLLRPLALLVNRQPMDPTEQGVNYLLVFTCLGREETRLRNLLVQLVGLSPLSLHELESVVGQNEKHVTLRALLTASEKSDAQLEQIVSRIALEKNIVGISWQITPSRAAVET
jgi:putative Mg2+ transporter-C (MgtC) family protein